MFLMSSLHTASSTAQGSPSTNYNKEESSLLGQLEALKSVTESLLANWRLYYSLTV